MTWDELVANVIARHPLHESKMFGMPCLKRENGENGKVVAGSWKDGGITRRRLDGAGQGAQAPGLPAPEREKSGGAGFAGAGAGNR